MESNPASHTSPEKRDFTYIVMGCGGIGSAALYWLSTQVPGEEVLGIERFEIGHVNGGSQDHSRIIRLRYNPLPSRSLYLMPPRVWLTSTPVSRTGRTPSSYDEQCYTTLAPHMYTAWKAVEDESGVDLVHKTGALVFGPKSGTEVDKVRSPSCPRVSFLLLCKDRP
jgi:sarcosine oxidase